MIPPAIIAIDGPSASGKSTTAAAVARAIGALHLDSGALYRALTRVALDGNLREPEAILAAAERRRLELRKEGGALVPFLDGKEAEARIRSPEVTALVSEVSAMPSVREWVNGLLREAVHGREAVVLDGRDIGTAVFPDAPVKIFLNATPEARARRRLLQRGGSGAANPEAAVREAAILADRDRRDRNREVAPLRMAPDALALDTTELSFEGQVQAILEVIGSRLPGLGSPDKL